MSRPQILHDDGMLLSQKVTLNMRHGKGEFKGNNGSEEDTLSRFLYNILYSKFFFFRL